MDIILDLYGQLHEVAGTAGIIIMALALACFIVQMYYYLGPYARIPSFRGKKTETAKAEEGISVIVILGNDYTYLENTLPKLMSQDHPLFELIIVELGTDPDFSDELAMIKMRYPNIVTTRMDNDPRFPISRKMAYNVGIKAASYEHILLTTDCATPVSGKWLSMMGKGFARADVVLGYCGVEHKPGAANALMRCNRLMMSVRYLSAAIKGRPYRGIIHNLGFTRKLYFENKGFGNLNMNLGEDDLFVQRIANSGNTTVVMNPQATTREIQWGSMDWWREQYKFGRATFPYYKAASKYYERTESVTRLLFYACIVALCVILPPLWAAGVAGLWLVRLIVVRRQVWRIRHRLGEKGLGWAMTFYDIIEPLQRIWFRFSSLINPPNGVWR